MNTRDLPAAATTDQRSFREVRGMVARDILENAGDNGGQHRLTQRDIADRIGTPWGVVYTSLKSMQELGAIRIERHRLYINKELLQKMAGEAARIISQT